MTKKQTAHHAPESLYILAALRSFCFYLYVIPWTLLWGFIAGISAGLLPKKWRYSYVVKGYCWPVIQGARWIIGIRYQVNGLTNLPEKAIIACNHQSAWEVIFLPLIFAPQVTVLKKSLLNFPFFGWGLRQTDPIAIDRSAPRIAAQQVLEQGREKLKSHNRFLMIFPEGTRKPPGELGRFSRSAALLAEQLGLPLVPVAQNSGNFWKNKKWVHFPGTVQINILPAIRVAPGNSLETINNCREQIQAALNSEKDTDA